LIEIRRVFHGDTEWLRRMQDERWGGQIQVENGQSYRPSELPGFVAEVDGERVGYAALRMVGDVASIGLIESLRARRGVGTSLVRALAEEARAQGCVALRAVTTNDNRAAQAFYAALGFGVREVRPGAVNESRRMKPSISLTSADGTPITDEIEYELDLRKGLPAWTRISG
jgi:GNAT superfamily N-acetyltransferase